MNHLLSYLCPRLKRLQWITRKLLTTYITRVKPLFGQGKVADYIPALANINRVNTGLP